ncbi:MAG: xanthine dehydrogenase family protein subunit M [Chloroflexi bacterium]|nr:xanthine dehydrogenase family protein subunit M [Chloroflexota bacterium]
MNLWKQYLCPKNVSDALHALTSAPPPVSIIAGGTDLMLDLQQGHRAPVHTLVDVTDVSEMKALEIRGDELYVGAAVPINRVVASPLVQEHAQALVEAGSLIGGPQVRNVATLGGNVAHALPAADGMIALVALDARAVVANPDGERRVPLLDLFLGPGKSALQPDELLVGFCLPLRAPHQASAFERIMRTQGVALPILNLALWLARDDDRIADVRIAVGPFGPTPRRALAAEDVLRGQPLTGAVLAQALDALLGEARFRTSAYRATADYRRHLAGVLLQDVLQTAWQRAE